MPWAFYYPRLGAWVKKWKSLIYVSRVFSYECCRFQFFPLQTADDWKKQKDQILCVPFTVNTHAPFDGWDQCDQIGSFVPGGGRSFFFIVNVPTKSPSDIKPPLGNVFFSCGHSKGMMNSVVLKNTYGFPGVRNAVDFFGDSMQRPIYQISLNEGRPLHSLRIDQGWKPNMEEILAILRTLRLALVWFHHKGWIHRDIKTGNIILNWQGVPKLIDIESSAFFADKDSVLHPLPTTHQNFCWEGWAWELIKYGPETDLWSLGTVGSFLIHGKDCPFLNLVPNHREYNVLEIIKALGSPDRDLVTLMDGRFRRKVDLITLNLKPRYVFPFPVSVWLSMDWTKRDERLASAAETEDEDDEKEKPESDADESL